LGEIQKQNCFGPRKGRNSSIDASVLEYFEDLRTEVISVIRETLMSRAKECARNSNILFKGSRGWCEKFVKTESLSMRQRTNISQKVIGEPWFPGLTLKT
jgi:hypothetical protein